MAYSNSEGHLYLVHGMHDALAVQQAVRLKVTQKLVGQRWENMLTANQSLRKPSTYRASSSVWNSVRLMVTIIWSFSFRIASFDDTVSPMPRFSFRGRFRARYSEFENNEIRAPIGQTRTLDAESHLFDIAEAHFDCEEYGTAKIFCWPSPEGITGRRWGRYRSVDAVILPFRTKASLSEDNTRLDTFELELFLCSSKPESPGALDFSKPCSNGWYGKHCNIHSEIQLVELPAPESMVGCPPGMPPNDNMLQKPWRFRSEVGCSCVNSPRAARWTWDAKGHDPIALYGGLALQHTGQPFLIACRVRGQAFVLRSTGRPGSILKFGGEKSVLKWWRVVPKFPGEDLSVGIEQLEVEMRRLNSRSTVGSSSCSGTKTDNASGHNFATTTIGGHATAILGNLTIGSESIHRIFSTGDQQYNPVSSTLGLPQAIGDSSNVVSDPARQYCRS